MARNGAMWLEDEEGVSAGPLVGWQVAVGGKANQQF
jgi:hypothetical protein